MSSADKKRIAIIGAGASGLPAIKSCLEEGLVPVCLERTSHIGGLWRYTDNPIEGQACVMKSTVINTCKEMMCYSDYPIPENFPVFMHNTQVYKYFKLYADAFKLVDHIRFNTEVIRVEKADDFTKTGRWVIHSMNRETKEESTEVFDGVLVCSGHHADKYDPELPGLKNFKGKVVHSHDYRDPQKMLDQRVVIVGIGNSGGDIAVELSRIASQVYMSTRRGTWILNRVADSGLPLDMINLNRFNELLIYIGGPVLSNLYMKVKLNWRFDHDIYRFLSVRDEVPGFTTGSLTVFISTRRGSWIYNRVFDSGYPVDMIFANRVKRGVLQSLGPSLQGRLITHTLNQRFNHDVYSLTPDYMPFQQHPMVNDEIPNRIICGAVKVKTDVKQFTETGLEFVDGTKEDNIDVVIKATGYSFGFPFLDKEVIDVQDNHVQLYKYMYPPNLEHPTLAIIGCFQPIGAIMPVSELQCRLATRVFKGDVVLPSRAEQWNDIRMKEAAMARRYVKSRRHTIQIDYIPFSDELANLAGCMPDYWSILKSDPYFAFKMVFGPVTPYHYRVQGPGKWQGAREAILSQWSRIEAPLKTRQLPTKDKSEMSVWMLMALAIMFFFVLKFLFF